MNNLVMITIAVIFAFLGGFLAKSIEMRNEFGDYFFFLKSSRKANVYRLIYGIVAILFMVLVTYTGLVDEKYIPDLSKLGNTDGQLSQVTSDLGFISVLISSFIIGLSSKAILDLPIAKSKDPEQIHFTVKDILAFIFPDVTKSFNNEIAVNQMKYLQGFIEKYQNPSVQDIAKKIYNYLDAHPDYQQDDGQRKIDIIMTELSQKQDSTEALRYLYRNLGRGIFSSALKS